MKKLNLALQGGGSHGAFTWGVLDALLAEPRIDLEGISGTSAGAINAVVLADGFARNGREGARQALAAFWGAVGTLGALSPMQRTPFDVLFGGWRFDTAAGNPWGSMFAQIWSPYQFNPLDINPLRDFLRSQVDFERVALCKEVKIFVTATRVSTGKAEIFSGARLTASAVMASCCLPMLFRAVEIEGDHFWDGGYSGNPAIHPLIYRCQDPDILLVQINPIRREAVPTTAHGIMDRINEITFNASLLAEMRAIDFVKRMLAEDRLDPKRYKDILLHRIDGGQALEKFGAASKLATDGVFIHTLHDLGVQAAQHWLAAHYDALGQRSTVNIARDYLDDLRLDRH
jgi:NTE family protein